MAVVNPEVERRAAAASARLAKKDERLACPLDAIKNLEHVKVSHVSTLIFGSNWMFYAFFQYGFLPLLCRFAPYQDKFLYWGSWVEL